MAKDRIKTIKAPNFCFPFHVYKCCYLQNLVYVHYAIHPHKSPNYSYFLKIEKKGRTIMRRQRKMVAIAAIFCFPFQRDTPKPKVYRKMPINIMMMMKFILFTYPHL